MPTMNVTRLSIHVACLCICLLIFWSVGKAFLNDYALALHGIQLYDSGHTYFIYSLNLFGAIAAFFLYQIFLQSNNLNYFNKKYRLIDGIADRTWIQCTTILAFLIPYLIHVLILDRGYLTDDETAYELSAQIAAMGKLYTESHPMKEFFDHNFIVNDGKYFSQYFLGWPFLMVPGVWINNTGLMNPLYSALTLPALFYISQHYWGRNAARILTILYLTSPMLMVGAATKMSHTSCLAALSWLMFFYLKSQQEPDRSLWHVLMAFIFSVAFFIRPLSAVAVASPILLFWAYQHLIKDFQYKKLICFLIPTLVMACVFLLINAKQTGSPWMPAYQYQLNYDISNNFRFSGRAGRVPASGIANITFPTVTEGLGKIGAGALRLNTVLYGWSFSLLLLLFAIRAPNTRLLWLILLSFATCSWFIMFVGVTTFAPVHYYEIALACLLLSAAGYTQAADVLSRIHQNKIPGYFVATSMVLSLVIISLVTYTPHKLKHIKMVASGIKSAENTINYHIEEDAVIFVAGSYISPCKFEIAKPYAFWRPISHPNNQEKIIWANHINPEKNKKFLQYFKNRKGYVMQWDDESCQVVLHPISK